MAAITPQMVKDLRDKTDAGMMECKKALMETQGDVEAAVEYLRKAGIAKSENRQDRATKEGKIFVACEGGKAVMLEILCETDFVANNEKFIAFGNEAAKNVLAATSGDGCVSEKAQALEEEDLKALFTKFAEKMMIRRALRFESANTLVPYLYGNGKIGVMLEVSGESDSETQKAICMHIAAYSPRYVNASEVPADAVAKEKEIAAAQLAGQNKKPEMIEKILAGKINKWYAEVCLVNQPWIHDEKSCIAKLFPKLKVERFTRWVAGEEA